VLQEAFTIVCVVIYCLLLLIPTTSRRRGVPVFVHLLLLAVLFCSAVHVRRNSFMMAVAALLLTLHVSGRVRLSTLVAGGAAVLVIFAALGNYRMGGVFEFPKRIGFPDFGFIGTLYEWPLIYLGQGVLNFNEYWIHGFPPAHGQLLLSRILPGVMEHMLHINPDLADPLRRFYLFHLFVLPGMTLRTGWFEFYYDFGPGGVIAASALFPLFVNWCYLRLVRSTPGRISVLYLMMAHPVLLFPFISIILGLFGWAPLLIGLLVDRILRGARRRDAPAPVTDEPPRRPSGFLLATAAGAHDGLSR